MGNVVIVILGLCLVLLTFSYIRQRIEDRENELLNQQAHKVYKKVERSIVISDNPVPASDIPCTAFIYIGKLEDFRGAPIDGYIGELNGYFYCYSMGKWHRLYEYVIQKW